jgi:hypothetical protein
MMQLKNVDIYPNFILSQSILKWVYCRT